MEYSRVKIKYDDNEISLFSLFETDHIYKHLKKTGNFYELKLLEKVKSLNLTGTYIDVGANIGNHTIFFSKFCKSTQVISIELDCEIYKVLQQNVINLPNVSAINIGVGEKFKYVKTSNINETNVGMTKIIGENGDNVVDTLDSILSDVNDISVIKIDVEGYEKNVLMGGKNIISKHSPVIITELRDEKEFNEFEKIANDIGYFTDKINYASTPTYFWYKKNEIYDFVYIIPTYERFDKVKPLIDDILTKNFNTLIIVLSDGSSDKRYKTLINFNKRVVYIENRVNNGKEKYWLTVNTLLNEMSKYKFKYGVMLGDDFKLIDGYQKKLEKYIGEDYILRLFTQQSIRGTNWGFENWVDGAFCAPYSFFEKINFELFPIRNNGKMVSSGVGLQMSTRITNLGLIVKNYGSLIEHIGNDDSKMHPITRLKEPLTANFEVSNKVLSIIIPTFDNPLYLQECLKSVIDSVENLNCEILVGIDGCNKTLDFIKGKSFDSRISFYFFEKNLGPYIIKNSLSQISNSKNILFFDSDDIMMENLISETIQVLSTRKMFKPKYFDFKNKNEISQINKLTSNKFGEGVFAIDKETFLSFNGFEGWRCAADSDFMGRFYKRNIPFSHGQKISFLRRIHPNSLTNNPETNMSSKLRAHYFGLSRVKRPNEKCVEFKTDKFTHVNTQSFTTNVVMTKNKPESDIKSSDILKKIRGTNPQQQTNSNGVDYDKLNKILYSQGVYDPKKNTDKPKIVQNKPIDRNKLIEIKKGSNLDALKKNLPGKPNRRKDAQNIFSKKNSR